MMLFCQSSFLYSPQLVSVQKFGLIKVSSSYKPRMFHYFREKLIFKNVVGRKTFFSEYQYAFYFLNLVVFVLFFHPLHCYHFHSIIFELRLNQCLPYWTTNVLTSKIQVSIFFNFNIFCRINLDIRRKLLTI